MSNLFVCAMGIGTVFVGLIALVFICMLLSEICKKLIKNTPAPSQAPAQAPSMAASGEIANKGEIVAACCVAIAEELGEDVRNIKVVAFKKA